MVPRRVGWRSGVAAVFFGYVITKMFSKIHLDIVTFTTDEQYLYITRILIITLIFLLDGPKALAGVSDDSTDMSKRDISTRKNEQAEKRLYEI